MTEKVPVQVRELAIKSQACFTQLKDEEIAMLANLLIPKIFKAGEMIVKEGDAVDSFYLLVEGEADVVHLDEKTQKATTVATLTAAKHDAIGLNESGFYSLTGLRTATVVAKTDVTTLSLTIALFHGFALYYSHVNEVMRKQSRQFVNVHKS